MTPFYYPIKPHILNQGWGTYDPKDYEQFGFTRHNGLDHKLAIDNKIYAPCNGTVVRKGFQPNGGGIFMGMITNEFNFPAFDCKTPEDITESFPALKAKVLIDFLHLELITVNEGDMVVRGQLIAIGDNTGFSTGPHCHTQWRRVTWDGKVINTLDVNDANNSFDPTQFFNGKYAADYYAFLKDFGYGSVGTDVEQLQKRLGMTAIGIFGPLTRAAVKGLQHSQNILETGFVGPLTRAYLNSAI